MEHQKKNKLALYAILGLSFLVTTPVFADVVKTQSEINTNTGLINNVNFGTHQLNITNFLGSFRYVRIYGYADTGTDRVQVAVYNCTSNCNDPITWTTYENHSGIDITPPITSPDFIDVDLGYEYTSTSTSNIYVMQITGCAGGGCSGKKMDLYGTDNGTQYCKYIQTYPTVLNCPNVKSIYYQLSDDGIFNDDYTTTHIVSLDPAQGSTTPSGVPVYINALAYIAEESSFWDTIKINLWTRDENSVLSRLVFTYQTDLYTVHFNGAATSTGLWRYSSTTMLADGNYTIQFSLGNSTLGGLVPNPFGGDTQVLTHQFVVGTSTFLGNLNQTIGQDIEDILQGKTSTSTAVLLSHCKPWSEAGFDIVDCLSGLMIPDKGKMEELFEDFKQGIVYKFPWGYGFRFFALATGGGTSTPPVLGFSVPDDEFFPPSLRNKAVSFDPWQALSSTSPLTTADGFGQGNLMDTVMPYWNIVIYGMVVLGVTKRVLNYRSEQTYEADARYYKEREFQGRMGKISRRMSSKSYNKK